MEDGMNFYDKQYYNDLLQSLPIIFTRETACKLLGGIFTPKTLSNFDASGKGPKRKVHIGRKVAYNRDDFIEWLKSMLGTEIKDIGKKKINPYW